MVDENTGTNINKIEVVSSTFGKEILVPGEKIISESRPIVWPSSFRPLVLFIAGLLVNWLIRYFRPEYMKIDYIADTSWIDTVMLWIGPAIMIIGVLSLLITWVRRNYTIYALTNKRIIRRTGAFSRAYLDCSLSKVQNVEVMMSPISRIFKFGNIRIATARTRGEDIEWFDVRNPIGLQRQINEALEKYLKENTLSG